jgi:hypothetical protein
MAPARRRLSNSQKVLLERLLGGTEFDISHDSNGSRAAGRNAPGDRPQTVCSSKWSRPDRNAAVAGVQVPRFW